MDYVSARTCPDTEPRSSCRFSDRASRRAKNGQQHTYPPIASRIVRLQICHASHSCPCFSLSANAHQRSFFQAHKNHRKLPSTCNSTWSPNLLFHAINAHQILEPNASAVLSPKRTNCATPQVGCPCSRMTLWLLSQFYSHPQIRHYRDH